MKRTIPRVPGDREDREYERVLSAGGDELVELLFGGRSDLHHKWKKISGASCRRPRRCAL